MAQIERPAALMTAIWSLSSSNRCEEAGIATLPKVLINRADIKSAGGVAPRVRTQGHRLMGQCADENKPAPIADAEVWASKTENFLHENMDDSFIARFRRRLWVADCGKPNSIERASNVMGRNSAKNFSLARIH